MDDYYQCSGCGADIRECFCMFIGDSLKHLEMDIAWEERAISHGDLNGGQRKEKTTRPQAYETNEI